MMRVSFLWLLLSVFWAQAALAHLPEFFGRKYVLLDGEPPVPPELRCGGAERGELQDRASALEEQLASRQLGEGAYSPGLSDPLGELGDLFAGVCNHPAALKYYRLALQRMRINEGLLTKAQIPYLKALADSAQAIGDYRSAQLNHRYIFRIHKQGQAALDEQALADSLDYFTRARDIFIDPRSGGDISLFFQAFSDNESMLQRQIALDVADYTSMQALALSHLYNLYLILGTEMTALQPNGVGMGNAATHLVSGVQSLAYHKGISLLEGLQARAAEQPAATRSQLQLRLGNWHQWNGNWRRACKAYAQSWSLAAGEGGFLVRQQLSQPAELPEDRALWMSLLEPDVPVRALLKADFKVSARGDVSAVNTQRLDEGNSALAGPVRRWLRDSHARPAIVDGECADGYLRARQYRSLR